MTEPNRRHLPRQNENVSVQILLMPGDPRDKKGGYDTIPAKVFNRSDEGLYIEVDQALRPGSNVDIKFVAPDDRSEKVYFVNNGRVIWCKKVEDEDTRFGIGVKILREVVRAGVPNSSQYGPAWS